MTHVTALLAVPGPGHDVIPATCGRGMNPALPCMVITRPTTSWCTFPSCPIRRHGVGRNFKCLIQASAALGCRSVPAKLSVQVGPSSAGICVIPIRGVCSDFVVIHMCKAATGKLKPLCPASNRSEGLTIFAILLLIYDGILRLTHHIIVAILLLIWW